MEMEHIDRRKSEAADALSRYGSKRYPVPPGVFLDHLHNPSVQPPKEVDSANPLPDTTLVAVT